MVGLNKVLEIPTKSQTMFPMFPVQSLHMKYQLVIN